MTEFPLFFTSFHDFCHWLSKNKMSQIAIITDHQVKKFYGGFLQKSLKKLSIPISLFSFPAGEKYKNHHTWQKIIDRMEKANCDRDTFIISVGGGVVGDLAGFVAATYMRGIAYAQIPTTMLAMVDSSIGGKTGINTAHGKNRIGNIYQPQCIVTDIMWLETLSEKHLINGLIEAIKMFATHDENSFQYISLNLTKILNGDKDRLKEIVTRAANIKKAIVLRDEKERGERLVLNFGHTIGHALETLSEYRLLHGYAVALGMLVEAKISNMLGILNQEQLNLLTHLLGRLGFYGDGLKKFNLSALIKLTKKDKKARFQAVNYILLKKIGHVYQLKDSYAHPVTDKIVRQAFNQIIKGLA